MTDQIDPRDFGALESKVETLSAQVRGMDRDIKELLALANKSKGAIWVGMTLASAFGAVAAIGIERAIK